MFRGNLPAELNLWKMLWAFFRSFVRLGEELLSDCTIICAGWVFSLEGSLKTWRREIADSLSSLSSKRQFVVPHDSLLGSDCFI